MTNFDHVQKKNIKTYNPNWLQIPNHLFIITIAIGGSAYGKANALFNLISQQFDIDKIHLHNKD